MAPKATPNPSSGCWVHASYAIAMIQGTNRRRKTKAYALAVTDGRRGGAAWMPKLDDLRLRLMPANPESGSPGASSKSPYKPGWPSGNRCRPYPTTLKIFVRPPLVAICSCSFNLASWYCLLIGPRTGCGIRGRGFQCANDAMTVAVSSSESTGPALASSSSSSGALASRAASMGRSKSVSAPRFLSS